VVRTVLSFFALALWVSPHWRVTFWLQPQKVTKKGRPTSFASTIAPALLYYCPSLGILRVPEFGCIANAPGLLRRPGAQTYNAEHDDYLRYQCSQIQQTKRGEQVKRKKQNNKTNQKQRSKIKPKPKQILKPKQTTKAAD